MQPIFPVEIKSGFKLSILSTFFGILVGGSLAILRYSKNKVLVIFIKFYISLIRGIPFLLQLFFIYFALPSILNLHISIFIAGILTMSMNSAAYVSEIFRGGIESVDKGQFEASESLSISYFRMMYDIILPQCLRSIFPSLINEITNLIKESAVIGVIGVGEIMRRSQIVAAEKYEFITPLCIAALLYYTIVYMVTFFGNFIEKKIQ